MPDCDNRGMLPFGYLFLRCVNPPKAFPPSHGRNGFVPATCSRDFQVAPLTRGPRVRFGHLGNATLPFEIPAGKQVEI